MYLMYMYIVNINYNTYIDTTIVYTLIYPLTPKLEQEAVSRQEPISLCREPVIVRERIPLQRQRGFTAHRG